MTLAIFGGGPIPTLPALPRRVMPVGARPTKQLPPRPCTVCGELMHVEAAMLARGKGLYCSADCRGKALSARVQERARQAILAALSTEPRGADAFGVSRKTATRVLVSLEAEGLATRVRRGPWVKWRRA